jgi:RNA polymerase sigma-70 factor (ECF subfamily)
MSLSVVRFGSNDPPEEGVELGRLDEALVCPSRLVEFDALWEACRVSVRAYLSSLLVNRSDVEDCVQEVALIAWKKGPVAEGQQAFLGHCLTSARLVGLAASRKVGRSRVEFLPPDVALSLADEVMRQEKEQVAVSNRVVALRACMEHVSGRQRELLGYRYSGEGRGKLEESARSLGKSPDAIYKMLERVRATLRNCVSKRMEEESDAS